MSSNAPAATIGSASVRSRSSGSRCFAAWSADPWPPLSGRWASRCTAAPPRLSPDRAPPPGPPRAVARRAASGGVALQVPALVRQVPFVSRRFVERAHAAGYPVHVWTVDDPAMMHTLLDLGVDGLMTDRTDLLRVVLLERGQWMGAGA